MPHTPETRARALQKVKDNRVAWIRDHGPCQSCGSTERLEVDHIDATQKVSHSVWSWSMVRRLAELEKCQVLCHVCHKKKTAAYQSKTFTGRVVVKLRKLSDKDVLKAVLLRKSGRTVREIARKFHVKHSIIVRLTRAAMNGKQFRSRGILLGKDL